MTTIVDVSPTHANTDEIDRGHSVTGRMLSVACSPDGQSVYVGSYANLWASDDAGRTFAQLTWPQPPAGSFETPGALGGWCVVDIAVASGWRVDEDPRCLATLTASGFADIVGFGDSGVWTALGNGDGTFQPPKVVLENFGYNAGGWRVDQHPRLAIDLTGNGFADIVGFGEAGVWTALGNGDGTFLTANHVLANFGVQQGWKVDAHPRFVVALKKGDPPSIIGFGDAGVWVAKGRGDGSFDDPGPIPYPDFGVQQGWRVDKHPRFVLPLTDSGNADIIGFGDSSVWTALGDGSGGFAPVVQAIDNFTVAQGWQVDRHPRFVAPITSSGFPDIVGFGDAGVYTARGDGSGKFGGFLEGLPDLGVQQGWQVDRHPRFAASLRGNGQADLIGFGEDWVWVALSNGDGTFGGASHVATNVLGNLCYDQGWRVDRHPRFVQSLTGAGGADLVGFGDAGVWTAMGNGSGGVTTDDFVLASFGYLNTVLALTAFDLTAGSQGVWRSTDGGANWAQAHQFPSGGGQMQVQWAEGSDHLVYVAGGTSLAISRNGGVTFEDSYPFGQFAEVSVTHVALWQNQPADSIPAVIYALGLTTVRPSVAKMSLSFDGGVTWMPDFGTLPANTGAPVSAVANANTPDVLVVSPRFPLTVYLLRDGSGRGYLSELFLGDYSAFPFGNRQSAWISLDVPNPLDQDHNPEQDSGNVFLATTRKGAGDLLFLGSQRFDRNGGSSGQPYCYVGPLAPASASDWKTLDQTVHVDLHGFLLSPDFAGTIRDGTYHHTAGTMWILSDGGAYWSTDGGQSFHEALGITSLGSLSLAGVSVPGRGPALSLNNGDNDGFYSLNGQHWFYQQYGGGDNDCAFADPLLSNTLMVFTPRWDSAGNNSTHAAGQTVSVYQAPVGDLPNAFLQGGHRSAVTGPPLNPPPSGWSNGDIWNALSSYGSRGSRPIVHTLWGETPLPQGDYAFIWFASDTQSQVVRTQNILDIVHRDEWATTATGPGQGASVYLQGPPLDPVDISVLQTSGGHAATVFYAGGDSTFGLWTLTFAATAWTRLVPGGGAYSAVRFFVDPYRPNRIYILDWDHVKRSEDAGVTWTPDLNLEAQLTWNGAIALQTNEDASGVGDHFDLILTDMKFDPFDPNKRFAIGQGGAFFTHDGVNWIQLLHTGALAGRPSSCYYDWISNAGDPALYVAFSGRSVVKISDLPQVIF